MSSEEEKENKIYDNFVFLFKCSLIILLGFIYGKS